jgi:DNA modification methylase
MPVQTMSLARVLSSEQLWHVECGDALETLRALPDESVQCVVTSPPYWGLRDYGIAGAIGLEPTPEEYVTTMVELFAEVRRALRADGTLWLNLGDAYAGSWGAQGRNGQMAGRSIISARQIESHPRFGSGTGARSIGNGRKPKDLIGLPWRVAFALQADGWWLRSDIIWSKPNPMPESVSDRPTKAHEYIFLLTKSARYFYDADAIREPASYPDGPNAPDAIASPYGQGFTRRASGGRQARHYDGNGFKTTDQRNTRFQGPNPADGGRNKRSVWEISTEPFPQAHFATYPKALVEPCVKAGSGGGAFGA